MSRIGKKPVEVPAGVKVVVSGQTVNVEGPKGKMSYTARPEIAVAVEDGGKKVVVGLAKGVTIESPGASAHWGSTRAHVRNMIEGVTKGYETTMHVVGTGWSATVSGKQLKLMLGYANPIMMAIPDGVNVAVDKPTGDMTPVKVSGVDRQKVGQFASSMRQQRKPEPYNGKGVKYATEVIKKKQGKQFGA
jgi:large subunit ribosomal protein L6